jgi:hypothetical protein
VLRTLICNSKDRAREYKLLKNLAGSDSGRVADSAFDSLPAIVAARQVGNPESQLTCLVAGYPERKRLCVQRKTKIPEFNSLCRYNNAEAVLQSLLSHCGNFDMPSSQ